MHRKLRAQASKSEAELEAFGKFDRYDRLVGYLDKITKKSVRSAMTDPTFLGLLPQEDRPIFEKLSKLTSVEAQQNTMSGFVAESFLKLPVKDRIEVLATRLAAQGSSEAVTLGQLGEDVPVAELDRVKLQKKITDALLAAHKKEMVRLKGEAGKAGKGKVMIKIRGKQKFVSQKQFEGIIEAERKRQEEAHSKTDKRKFTREEILQHLRDTDVIPTP